MAKPPMTTPTPNPSVIVENYRAAADSRPQDLQIQTDLGWGLYGADKYPEAVEQFENVERYAPGIRPLRVSFAMLWDALRRTIPGFYDDAPDTDKAWLNPARIERIV